MNTTLNIVVTHGRILGTGIVKYEAWEPYAGHSTFSHLEGYGKMGRVAMRPCPPEIDTMAPMSDERIDAVCMHFAETARIAYEAIEHVLHPNDLAIAQRDGSGDITVYRKAC